MQPICSILLVFRAYPLGYEETLQNLTLRPPLAAHDNHDLNQYPELSCQKEGTSHFVTASLCRPCYRPMCGLCVRIVPGIAALPAAHTKLRRLCNLDAAPLHIFSPTYNLEGYFLYVGSPVKGIYMVK